MITKDTKANHFICDITRNGKSLPFKARRNGKTKTWKTRPDEFKIPIKHGLYWYGYITHENADQWTEESFN